MEEKQEKPLNYRLTNFKGDCFKFALYSYDDDKETAYLSDVHVESPKRGVGIGNKILNLAEKEARKWNYTRICLKVLSNSWMHEWYKRHGYYDIVYNDSEYVWMRLDLTEKK